MLDIINEEFDINVGDKVFKLKALSLNSILKLSKQLKAKETIANAKLISATLPQNEQGKFMLDVLYQLGKPAKIQEELEFTDTIFSSILGITEIVKFAILKNNKIEEKELDELIDANFSSDYYAYIADIAARLLGVAEDVEAEDEKEKDTEEVTDDDEEAEKKSKPSEIEV